MSKNTDEILDHNYDGIQEFDNPLPGWWSLTFLLCTLFAIPYLAYTHFADGHLMLDEYQAEVEALEAVKKGGGGGAAVDATEEGLATLAGDAAEMAKGKEIFLAKCAVCHGKLGEGGIGPNMTDDYAIHGHAALDRLKVIIDGVPAKGMISWKSQLSGEELQIMAAYVGTLQGTTPPNPKAPEGTKAE